MRPEMALEAASVAAAAAAALYDCLQPWEAPRLSQFPRHIAEMVRKSKDMPAFPAEVRPLAHSSTGALAAECSLAHEANPAG